MRLRRFHFTNHVSLGNLRLDFVDDSGIVPDTIILAGENGTGKSQILNAIYEFTNYGLSQNRRPERRYIEIEVSEEERNLLAEVKALQRPIQQMDKNIIGFEYNFENVGDWSQVEVLMYDHKGEKIHCPSSNFADARVKRVIRSLFSDAEINFTPKEIRSVTSTDIDDLEVKSERSNVNLATEISQLLVDIQSIDALDFSRWAKENVGQQIDASKIDVRIKRFAEAYEYMFPSKRYKRIDTINNRKEIIFEEHNKEMSIGNLSTGEKQIVFRGGFLLRDRKSSQGAIVLIDEPELSLHPKWQLRIVPFFKKLFQEEGSQTCQIIFATHSPFIIHNVNRHDDRVIVLVKNEDGVIESTSEPKYFDWKPETHVRKAFNVTHIVREYHNIVFVEGETDELYFRHTMKLFNMNNNDIVFSWIGRINESGNAEFTGDGALNHACTFFTANPELIIGNVLLLYDSDTKKRPNRLGNLWIECATSYPTRHYGAGTENLLRLPATFSYNDFYRTREKVDPYGATTIIQELDKRKLCDHLCNDMDELSQKSIFSDLKSEIERIIGMLTFA